MLALRRLAAAAALAARTAALRYGTRRRGRRPGTRPGLGRALALGLAALASASAATPARADDRDLVRGAVEPYVLLLLDLSAGMSAAAGGAWAPAAGDDPTARLPLAKSALFEVLSDAGLAGVSWGFATSDQDGLAARRKHWLYAAAEAPPWVSDGRLAYPRPGEPKVFGDRCMSDAPGGANCTLDGDDRLGDCFELRDPADPEARGELASAPVLGERGRQATSEWLVSAGRRYRLDWSASGGELGAEEILVRLRLRQLDGACAAVLSDETVTLPFRRAHAVDAGGNPLSGPADFLFWQRDDTIDVSGAPAGFWDARDTAVAAGACSGWEPNDDGADDDRGGIRLKRETAADPAGRHPWAFDRGDVVPFDWRDVEIWGSSNRDAIRGRLAPNRDPDLCSPEDPRCPAPEVRAAPYFEDHPDPGPGGGLRPLPAWAERPPLIAEGPAPLGNALRDAAGWLDAWIAAAEDPGEGDPRLACRPRSVVLLTAGAEECYQDADGDFATGETDDDGDANPCWAAGRLGAGRAAARTYAVGIGAPPEATELLSCIAEKGGTGAMSGGPGALMPQTRRELVADLRTAIAAARDGGGSGVVAAVPPALEALAGDRAFVATFRPMPQRLPAPDEGPVPASTWDGHLDAFRLPVPLTSDGLPDESQACDPGTGIDRACHLWDAAAQLLRQSPSHEEALACDAQDPAPCRLGSAPDERRVYWARVGAETMPLARRLLRPPADSEDQADLWHAMGLSPSDPQAEARATAAIRHTLERKIGLLDGPGGSQQVEYLLGDIFHSTPIRSGSPGRADYHVADLYGNGRPCDDAGEPSRGYRCFAERHRLRRRIVLAGSDDGQLHAFDAGLPVGAQEPEPSFDDGTGLEVFAYVPRPLLATLRRQAEEPGHTWGADGAVWVDDAFLDPRHRGVPDAARREWRTLAVGGLREGGHGYFALDITQPDELDRDGRPRPGGGRVPSCLGGDDGEQLPPSCGPVPFPAPLWEFADALDEDGNGGADMAQTWSTPNTGRIRVCGGPLCDPASEPNDVEDRFVAVVGGGLDPAFWAKRGPPQGGAPAEPDGNWLYMLDLETGRTLFKRRLSGSAASEPAAVDTDRDGYLDTVYIGTTDGVLFKADIGAPGALGEVELPGGRRERRVTDPAWSPFPLFAAADETGRGRPLFFPPAVIHVAGGAGFALGFGTGDRHDLWAERRQEGRFYLILDTGYSAADHAAGTLPLTEESYVELAAEGAEESGENLLLDPPPGKLPGWFMRLAHEERATSSAVAVAGVVAFSTFVPATGGSERPGEDACARGGRSRTYAVLAPNGDAVLREKGERRRFVEVDGLAGVPFLQLAVGPGAEDTGGDGGDGTDADLDAIRKELEEQFPPGCRFPNLTLSLRAALPGGGTRVLAPIPVCVREKNWREF